MEYRLSITKQRKNEKYEESLGYRLGYRYGPEEPAYIEETLTTVTLTEEQFKKVQKAIIESME